MKVFCIGTWKTGTTSVGQALHQLIGGKHISWNFGTRDLYLSNKFDDLIRIAKLYDTFDDTPWNCLDTIDLLVKEFPSAKFILSYTDPIRWLNSVIRWYHDDINLGLVSKENRIAKRINGNTIIANMYIRQFGNDSCLGKISENKESWINWYNQRNLKIKKLIKPTNLLEYEIGSGWNPICKFLDKEIPSNIFPHLNKNS